MNYAPIFTFWIYGVGKIEIPGPSTPTTYEHFQVTAEHVLPKVIDCWRELAGEK